MKKNSVIKSLTWAHVDLEAIGHNFKQIKALTRQNQFISPALSKKRKKGMPEIMAVVKSGGYGHGMIEVARVLVQKGVDFLGVSDLQEGIQLREHDIKVPILLLESPLPQDARHVVHYALTPTVNSIELADVLHKAAQAAQKRIPIHINLDTGMGRLGVTYQEAFSFVQKLQQYSNLILEGIYTHLAVSDSDRAYTQHQIKMMDTFVRLLDKAGFVIPYVHGVNSMGLMGYHTKIFNLVRPGLMIYGLYPSEVLKDKIKLKPALSIQSRIIFIQDLPKGSSVSYGRTYIAKYDMKIAVIPIGYNDGYLRALSNQACMLVNGVRCPVIGRVTMEQTMIDITRAGVVKIGTPVTILGKQDKLEITADELASLSKTINYEIVCSLGNRLPRKYSS